MLCIPCPIIVDTWRTSGDTIISGGSLLISEFFLLECFFANDVSTAIQYITNDDYTVTVLCDSGLKEVLLIFRRVG